MTKELVELRKSSFEAEIVLTNFATRKRIHKDKEIALPRLYHELRRKGYSLSRSKFDKVFDDLERLGYGIVDKNQLGYSLRFLPDADIKSLGKDSQELAPQIKELTVITSASKPISVNEMVLVVVIKNGKTIRMHINKDDLDHVNDLVG